MSRNPKSESTLRDNNSRFRDFQPETGISTFSERYIARVADIGLKDADISRLSGIPTSTLSRYRKGGTPSSEHIFPLADALKSSARWLISGAGESTSLRAADDAEWVDLPEYDLRQLDDHSKGQPIGSTRFRRDWLNRSIGRDRGLWLAKLPGDYPSLDLQAGDQVICCDTSSDELAERQLCIWFMPLIGKLIVARYSVLHRGNQIVVMDDGEYWANPHLVDGRSKDGGDDLYVVGRIVGRPLSPIR